MAKLTWTQDKPQHWKGYLGERWLFDLDCYRQGYRASSALYRVGKDRRLGLLMQGRDAKTTKAYAASLVPQILEMETA
jgi:hypothetical protein